jgi:hypothetical protein
MTKLVVFAVLTLVEGGAQRLVGSGGKLKLSVDQSDCV